MAAGWQALTVRYSFGGNWTALYYTGALFKPVPPPLQPEHIYVFPQSYGYDAQIYHYLAHDPLFRHNYSGSMDDPRYRGRRILVPALAFLFALGRASWIDPAYLIVIWMFIGAGVYWLGRFAHLRGYPTWIGLGFLLVPATLVSIDRLTIDVALAACCAGFALYAAEDRAYQLYAVLTAAALSRETGLLLAAAYCLHLALEYRWSRALAFSTTALPTLAWYLYLSFHTPPSGPMLLSLLPFSGLADRFLHPAHYSFGTLINGLAAALDLLSLIGIVAAIAWAGRRGFQRAGTPVTLALYLFALLALAMGKGDLWSEVFAYGRTLTPLLFLAVLDGLSLGTLLPACAMLMVYPRVLLQLGPQFLNVFRGSTG